MKLSNGNFIRPAARYSWWFRQGRYIRYMLRELSSLFIGTFTLTLVWGLYRLGQGKAEFQAWTMAVWSNSAVVFSLLVLAFSAYHSFTWFMLTPKAMPLKLAGKRLSAWIIITAHFGVCLLASVIVWGAFIYGGAR